jgi:hypothetical protein
VKPAAQLHWVLPATTTQLSEVSTHTFEIAPFGEKRRNSRFFGC